MSSSIELCLETEVKLEVNLNKDNYFFNDGLDDILVLEKLSLMRLKS